MATKNADMAREARLAYEKWCGAFKQNIDRYHDMHDFVLGAQWSKDEQDEMITTYRKVPLVSNKLGSLSNSLRGEQQQNTPQLQVVPMTECEPKVASLREIITKDIMFSSHATTTYQVFAGQAAIGGFSAYCLGTEYAHSKSGDQDIKYYYFKDPTRCYWDLSADSINKTDGEHCGYWFRMSRKKVRSVYGKEVEESIGKVSNITQSQEEIALAVQPNESEAPFQWADDDSIVILNHFKRVHEEQTIYRLSNGKWVDQEEMDELIESSKKMNARHQQDELQMQPMGAGDPALANGMPVNNDLASQLMQMGQGKNIAGQEYIPEGTGIAGGHDILPQDEPMYPVESPEEAEAVEDSNEDRVPLWDEGQIVRIEQTLVKPKDKIFHYQFAGDYELDKTEFPTSEHLPMPFVDHDSYYDKDGKQITRSFFGDCKDTQRYINYLRTQSAYILKTSRFDQFMGSKKNVTSLDTQAQWRNPTNVKGMLTYDESPSGAKPEQIRPPELSVSLFQQYELAIQDLYTSTGLYPARMGNNGDEASGSAIDARTRQGSYATYVFFNSINRAITTGGEIVNEMIPRVYDSERVMALMMPDKGMKNITINRQADDYGEVIENDIRKGTYQVRLKAGPSYEGQKEIGLQALRDVLQVDPASFKIIADLYGENLPLANNIEIKNRLKCLVPPEIIEAGKTGEMPKQGAPTPEQQAAQVEAQAQQAQQQYMQAQIQIKQQELMLKQKQMQADIEIERMKLEIAQMEQAAGIEESKLRFMAESGRTQTDKEIAHADNLVKILTSKYDTPTERATP